MERTVSSPLTDRAGWMSKPALAGVRAWYVGGMWSGWRITSPQTENQLTSGADSGRI